MKATVTTLAAVLALTLGTAAAQTTQTQATPASPAIQATDAQKSSNDVTLTGCVVQGSGPTVFIFDNAKKDPASTSEKGLRYIFDKVDEDIDLRTHLNKEVRITAEVDAKVTADPVTPAVPPDPEKSLPKLKVKSVTMVSDTCALVR